MLVTTQFRIFCLPFAIKHKNLITEIYSLASLRMWNVDRECLRTEYIGEYSYLRESDTGWSIFHQEEVHNLHFSYCILRNTNLRRMGWARCVACMKKKRKVYEI
jgi:hypothetical protein